MTRWIYMLKRNAEWQVDCFLLVWGASVFVAFWGQSPRQEIPFCTVVNKLALSSMVDLATCSTVYLPASSWAHAYTSVPTQA